MKDIDYYQAGLDSVEPLEKLPLRTRMAIVLGILLSLPISIILIPLLLPPLFVWSCIQVWRMNHA